MAALAFLYTLRVCWFIGYVWVETGKQLKCLWLIEHMTYWRDIKGIYLIERINIGESDIEPIYYVGQSVGVFNRWRQHCEGNEQRIDLEIKRFGPINFSFSILEVVSKTEDLNERETYWINEFKRKGESSLFNVSQTNNRNQYVLDSSIKNEIKSLFEEEIGRSIYAISEKYRVSFREVVKLRKPLLKGHGLKYDNRSKNIVDDTGQFPDYWKGDRLTQTLAETILKLESQGLDISDIAYECNISKADLSKFLGEYSENDQVYDFAESIN